jgi:hypothetical protein
MSGTISTVIPPRRVKAPPLGQQGSWSFSYLSLEGVESMCLKLSIRCSIANTMKTLDLDYKRYTGDYHTQCAYGHSILMSTETELHYLAPY